MSDLLRVALLYGLVPVGFTILGALGGAYLPPLQRVRGHVLHFAAGVVFSVVAVELLPEIQRRSLVVDVIIGFALGIATMLAVDALLDRIRGEEHERRDNAQIVDVTLLVAVAIDFLLDGLLLGVGFAAGARIGILLALAEAAEQLSVGLAVAGELLAARVSRARIVLIVSALGSLVFVAAILGVTVLRGLPGGAMEAVLSFGLAALLYLVTEELLREAHEQPESRIQTAMFFLGFLLFLVIGMVLD